MRNSLNLLVDYRGKLLARRQSDTLLGFHAYPSAGSWVLRRFLKFSKPNTRSSGEDGDVAGLKLKEAAFLGLADMLRLDPFAPPAHGERKQLRSLLGMPQGPKSKVEV